MNKTNKKLTYGEFYDMVKRDYRVGASPDEHVSDEEINRKAKNLYHEYLNGTKLDDLFMYESENDNDELSSLISKEPEDLRKKSEKLNNLADVIDDLKDTANNLQESYPMMSLIINDHINEYEKSLSLNEHIEYVNSQFNKTNINESFKLKDSFNRLIEKVKFNLNESIEKYPNYQKTLKAYEDGDYLSASVYLNKTLKHIKNLNECDIDIKPAKTTKKNLVEMILGIK